MSALARDELGETLIELMITVLVISIGMVTMVGAVGSSIIASDAHRGYSVGEVVIRDFAEAIKVKAAENRDIAGVSTFVPCPDEDQLEPGTSFTAPAGWNRPTIDRIEWWIPAATDPTQGAWSDSRSDCLLHFDKLLCTNVNASSCDAGLQRVTFTVTNDKTGAAAAEVSTSVIVRRANESST